MGPGTLWVTPVTLTLLGPNIQSYREACSGSVRQEVDSSGVRGRVRIHPGVSGGAAEFCAHRLWRPDAMRPVGLLHSFRSSDCRHCS